MKISFLSINSLATSASIVVLVFKNEIYFFMITYYWYTKLQILLFCDRTTYSVMVNFKQLPIHSTTIVQYNSTGHTGL